ncbi:MAG: TetR/AcrR family transcriptional regulator [Bauldia litoralis]
MDLETVSPKAEANKRGRSRTKRRLIVSGAAKVFLADGFGGATMDAVALAAGVSKMTVYRYFRSKEELFAGVIGDQCDRIVDDEVSASMAELPPKAALELFGRRMIEIVFAPETLKLHRIVIAEAHRFPDLSKLFYESGPQANVELLARYFRAHRRDPGLRVGDPRRSAEEFMSILRGYEHMRALLGYEDGLTPAMVTACVERAMKHVLT